MNARTILPLLVTTLLYSLARTSHAIPPPDGSEAAFIRICLGYNVKQSDSCNGHDGNTNEFVDATFGDSDGIGCEPRGEDFYFANDELHPYWYARNAFYVLRDENDEIIDFGRADDDNACFYITQTQWEGADGRFHVDQYLDARFDEIFVRARETNFVGFDSDTGAGEFRGKCFISMESLAARQVNDAGPPNLDEPNPSGVDPPAMGSNDPGWCDPLFFRHILDEDSQGNPVQLQAEDSIGLAIPQAMDPEATLMALTQFAVFWWDQDLQMSAGQDDVTITVIARDVIQGDTCVPSSPCSAAWWLDANFANAANAEMHLSVQTTFPDRLTAKYLVGHEVGHLLEAIWGRNFKGYTGGYLGYTGAIDSYSPNGGGAVCQTEDNVILSHGMTTLEWASPAANEGFAHFVAADVYNALDRYDSDAFANPLNEGKFNYYKHRDLATGPFDFAKDFFLEGQEGAAAPEGDILRWRDSQCVLTDASLAEFAQVGSDRYNVGVEVDWMRFYWDVHSWLKEENGLADKASRAAAHRLLLELHAGAIAAANGAQEDNFFDLLRAHVCDTEPGGLTDALDDLGITIDQLREKFVEFAGLGPEGNGVATPAPTDPQLSCP